MMKWNPFDSRYVTRSEYNNLIAQLNKRMAKMASQEDVDALTQAVQDQGAQLGQVAADIQTAHDALQAELDNLEGQISGGGTVTSLHLEGLKAAIEQNAAAIAPLDGAVQALGGLTPTEPTPTPEAEE